MVADERTQRRELDRLLAETVDEARQRERTTFDRATKQFGDRLVLFGAGNLGRKALGALRADGIEPLAFVDNNAALWGSQIEGIPVLAPLDGARRFGDSATFCIAIWRGEATDTMSQRRQPLLDAGCVNVVDFGALFWKYQARVLPHYSLDLPHHVLTQAEAVRAAFDLWTDDASRAEYVAQVRWRLWLDFDNLPPPVEEEIYYPRDLVDLSDDDVFVDCGAYDGDTVRAFIDHAKGRFKRIYAFEADQSNFRRLRDFAARAPEGIRNRLVCSDAALADRRGWLFFSETATAASAVAKQGVRVRAVTLDEELAEAPTWIKMDIEGSEPAALRGAQRIIANHAPILSICVYHSQNHLWDIPLQIAAMHSEYGLYLRPFVPESWDLVCYAIPCERLRPRGVR
jgi:FkbM family methyltransferase